MHPNHKIFLKFLVGVLFMACGIVVILILPQNTFDRMTLFKFIGAMLLILTGYDWIKAATN